MNLLEREQISKLQEQSGMKAVNIIFYKEEESCIRSLKYKKKL